MHIESVPNRKSHPTILLRESYRADGKVKKRTIANLTNWPEPLVEGLRTLLRGAVSLAPANGQAWLWPRPPARQATDRVRSAVQPRGLSGGDRGVRGQRRRSDDTEQSGQQAQGTLWLGSRGGGR